MQDSTRTTLVRLAYGLTGSVAEAEDIAQEALLRLHLHAHEVRHPMAWLRTTATRLALDALGSARARRETYPGPWLPEPIPLDPVDPDLRPALVEALSMATLVLLEQLSPAERAAYVLRVAFEVSYPEIASTLDRSEAAVRQLVHRAQAHIDRDRLRFDPDPHAHEALFTAFATASLTGDLTGLTALLTQDVVFTSDGGGKRTAALRPLLGPDRVARFILGVNPSQQGAVHLPTRAVFNGHPAVVFWAEDGVESVVLFLPRDGQVAALYAIRNPDKLRHVTAAWPRT